MRTKISRNWIKNFFFIISMAIACTRDYGDEHVGFYAQIIIGIIWILFALIKLIFKSGRKKTQDDKDSIWFLKLYMTPQIVIYIYTVVIMALGLSKWEYLGTNMTSFVPIFLSVMSYYLYKEKAIKYICVAIGLSWLISIVSAFIYHGFSIITSAIIQGYIDHYYISGLAKNNYFEIHDIVLSVGYYIVFYIYSKKLIERKERPWFKRLLMFFLLVSVLGFKRIVLLGILCTWLFKWIIDKLPGNRLKICRITGWIGVFACYGFIALLIYGNWLFDTAAKLRINPAGREWIFRAVLKLADFRVLFPGLGRGAVTYLLTNKMKYLRVAGVHSDIIKMYVECGFILFGWWLWYFLVHNTNKYAKKFNSQAAVTYFGITIFMFVLYLTDNTDTYFACQILYVILPITCAEIIRRNETPNCVKMEYRGKV